MYKCLLLTFLSIVNVILVAYNWSYYNRRDWMLPLLSRHVTKLKTWGPYVWDFLSQKCCTYTQMEECLKFNGMVQTFVDRQEVTDSMASSVQVVVTNVPQRWSRNNIQMSGFQAVREDQGRQLYCTNQHPCVCLPLILRWCTEMQGSCYIGRPVCTKYFHTIYV